MDLISKEISTSNPLNMDSHSPSTMRSTFSKFILALYLLTATLPKLSLAIDTSASDPPTLALPAEYPSSVNISSLVVTNSSLSSSTNAAPILALNDPSPQYDVLPAASNANVQCDSGSYGVNLDRNACLDAMSKIGSDTNLFTATQRGLGKRPNVVLPNRYSSCKKFTILTIWPLHKFCFRANVQFLLIVIYCLDLLTDMIANGRCVIDLVIHIPGIVSDRTTNLEITQAAQAVINDCVRQAGPTEGGSVGGVGMFSEIDSTSEKVAAEVLTMDSKSKGTNNNLAVVVRRYSPFFKCSTIYGQAPPIGSCTKVIAIMPVSTDDRVFGWRRKAEVTEPTPRNFRGGEWWHSFGFGRFEGGWTC